MYDIELKDVSKIYPYTQVKGLLGRKRRQALLEKQRAMPHTTNEGVVVLRHVSARIQPGEFVVLLGPSGCGKTTLLRLIAGLEEPTLGSICFNGRDMEGVAPEDRDAAMVFQNYSLYPHLTVFDNIAFPLRNQHMPRQELRKTVEEIAGLLEITPYLRRLPSQLSGGQLQRVAIARALVRKPRLFLLDEPFSNLDAPLRASLRQLVKKIHTVLGTTFLYVTHDQQEALALGSRILVMKDGAVVQDGTPAELYTRPVCTEAALALGSPRMNLIPAEQAARLLPGRAFPAGTATVGIRPVHLLPVDKGIPARLRYAEPLGSETVLHLTAGETELTLVTESRAQFLRGAEVNLEILTHRLHFFDGAGNRIHFETGG